MKLTVVFQDDHNPVQQLIHTGHGYNPPMRTVHIELDANQEALLERREVGTTYNNETNKRDPVKESVKAIFLEE